MTTVWGKGAGPASELISEAKLFAWLKRCTLQGKPEAAPCGVFFLSSPKCAFTLMRAQQRFGKQEVNLIAFDSTRSLTY